MGGPTRRGVITAGAGGLLLALAACSSTPYSLTAGSTGRPGHASATPTPTPTHRPQPPSTPLPLAVDVPQPVPVLARVPAPDETITGLPDALTDVMAWTVDDGTSSAVVSAYTAFAAASGHRFTFFVTGSYDSWDANADALRPLVARGQIQLANHTWSHPDLTTLPTAGIVDELQRNHDYIERVYGVDARPFYRPPFGRHDDRVDAAAASIGYTVPTLWYGTLSDSGLITDQQVVDFATQWFLPGHIVIGHLNFEPVTHVFPQLRALLRQRGLRTVTLNDVFTSTQHP